MVGIPASVAETAGHLMKEWEEINKIKQREEMSTDKLLRRPYIKTPDGKLYVDLMLKTDIEIKELGEELGTKPIPKPFIEDGKGHLVYKKIIKKEYRVPTAYMNANPTEELYTIRFVKGYIEIPEDVAKMYPAKQVTKESTTHTPELWDAVGYKDKK